MIEEHLLSMTRSNDILREIVFNNLYWLDDYVYDCPSYEGQHIDFHKALYLLNRARWAYETDFKKTR